MSQVSDGIFTMVVYETVYLEAYTNKKCIGPKYNTAQLYFILGRADLMSQRIYFPQRIPFQIAIWFLTIYEKRLVFNCKELLS